MSIASSARPLDAARPGHAGAPPRRDEFAYLPHVDGMRALAILAVVLFHAGVPGFSGGFVGVDVFFVISGYLITSIIRHDMERDRFSLRRFYARRILRIYPALFATVAATLVAGCVLLLTADLRSLCGSAVAALLYVSNVFFWRHTGYFGLEASEQPLLHTWSLSVEEQLYVVFPALLLATRRLAPRLLAPILLLLLAASFGASLMASYTWPSAAFFLLPFRAWEFLAGSLAAIVAWRPASRATAAAGGAAGLALIACAVALLDQTIAFPGWVAVLPVAGSLLLLVCGGVDGAPVRTLLTRPALVLGGRMSYSVYLWHFPVLGYLRYVTLDAPSRALLAVGVLASLALGAASWRFIESPFRTAAAKCRPAWQVFGAALAATLVVGSFAYALEHSDRAVIALRGPRAEQALRIDRETMAWAMNHCLSYDGEDQFKPSCMLGEKRPEPSFVLWGDSHAEALAPALDDIARSRGLFGYLVGAWDCPPTLGVAFSQNHACRTVGEALLHYVLATPSIRTVIIEGYWSGYASGLHLEGHKDYATLSPAPPPALDAPLSGDDRAKDNAALLEAGLRALVARLEASGRTVWLVGPVPENLARVPRAVHLAGWGISPALQPRRVGDITWSRESAADAVLTAVARQTGAGLIRPSDALCPDGTCRYDSGGVPLYRDEAHLNSFGARTLSGILGPTLDHND